MKRSVYYLTELICWMEFDSLYYLGKIAQTLEPLLGRAVVMFPVTKPVTVDALLGC